MLSASIDQVLATLGVSLAYLLLVRLADVNEREPLWSVATAFVIGGAAAGALFLGVDRATLFVGAWPGAVWREVSLAVALAVVFQVFRAVERLQGWPLVADPLDGLIYGAAAGLGFSCAETIATLAPDALFGPPNLLEFAGRSAVTGLAQGVFGALLGAGVGRAAGRQGLMRWIGPLVGLGLAVAAHGLHDVLAHGDALAGESGVWRRQLAMGLPLVAVVGFAIFELLAERRAIARELAGEIASGDVTADELSLLTQVPRRQRLYLSLLLRGRLAALRAVAAMHNQQAMLALLTRRATGGDEASPARAARELAAVRRAIRDSRARLSAASEVTQ